MSPGTGWTTPSELAEYVYCPRAHYYRRTYGSSPPNPDSVAGERYHARALGGEFARAGHGTIYWAVVAAGALLAFGGTIGLLWP